MKPSYYIQYHNADNKGQYPNRMPSFTTPLSLVLLEDSVKYGSQFYTSKRQVEKALGQFCFLIVGKTEKVKNYCLWSYFQIEDYVQDEDGFYDVYGTGFDFKKPMLLNELPHFREFKTFCGNFGIGFQNINNHVFCETLISLASYQSITTSLVSTHDNLQLAIQELNKRMQKIQPSRRIAEIELILRKDGRIVKLLKESAKHSCQFPNCSSKILTKQGTNYVEVAHIKPVNKGGQSILGNLLVLCPNHHKEFDHGSLIIEKQTDVKLVGSLNGKKFTISQK